MVQVSEGVTLAQGVAGKAVSGFFLEMGTRAEVEMKPDEGGLPLGRCGFEGHFGARRLRRMGRVGEVVGWAEVVAERVRRVRRVKRAKVFILTI